LTLAPQRGHGFKIVLRVKICRIALHGSAQMLHRFLERAALGERRARCQCVSAESDRGRAPGGIPAMAASSWPREAYAIPRSLWTPAPRGRRREVGAATRGGRCRPRRGPVLPARVTRHTRGSGARDRDRGPRPRARAFRCRNMPGTTRRRGLKSTTEPGTDSPRLSSERTPNSCNRPIVGDRHDLSRRGGERLRRADEHADDLARRAEIEPGEVGRHRGALRQRGEQPVRIDLYPPVGADENQVGLRAREQHRLRKHSTNDLDHRQRRRRRHLVGREHWLTKPFGFRRVFAS